MKSSVVDSNLSLKRPIYGALISCWLLSSFTINSSWASPTSHSDSSNNVTRESDCELTDQKREMLTQINEIRSQEQECGSQHLPAAEPLTWSCTLEEAAHKHSQDMAENDYFSHTSPDGSEIQNRVSDSGYEWQAVGENIAAGHLSSSAAIEGWLESPGHCRNLMSEAFSEMGIAEAKSASSDATFPSYWTQILANPR
jgi:uncharacterized protein YkwD